jgi:hypothetical protein
MSGKRKERKRTNVQPDLKQKAFVAIDPAFGSMGVAVWHGDDITPAAVSLVHAPRLGDQYTRALAAAREAERVVVDTLEDETLDHLLIELPEFHGSAFRQMGWKTGDLQALTFLVGVVVRHFNVATTLVTPSGWKGQLSKEIVTQRITKRLGSHTCHDLRIEKDGWDAVGIGLWAVGYL